MLKPAIIDKLKKDRKRREIENRIPIYAPNHSERIKQKNKNDSREEPKSGVIVIELA